jgi:phosphoadenosine phosphosulfate reductase
MELEEKLMFEGWANLPQFKKKVDQAKSIIKQALEIAPAYVAVSWGKDSVVMLHLCQQVQPDIVAIFLTDSEQENFGNYSDVIKQYLDKYQTNYLELDLIGDRIPHKFEAAELWKTYPVAFQGLRLEEGGKRKFSLNKYGHTYQLANGSYRVCPLIYWGWKDIWAYIVINNLPYLDVYDHSINSDRSKSRSCNLLAKEQGNTKAVETGRIARLRLLNPEYYNYLQENYPHLASAT